MISHLPGREEQTNKTPRATHWDGAGIFCVLALLSPIMEYIPEKDATLE